MGDTNEFLESVERRLRELEDKEAIRHAIYAYVRGTDRCDRDLIEAAYHEDAWDEHGTFRGPKSVVVEHIASNPSGAPVSMHHIGNILIALDGDIAEVETYFLACQVREQDGRSYSRVRAGRYLDRFERRDGRWRVARRFVVDDWSRLDEIVSTDPALDGQAHFGRRDATDASYDVLSNIGKT